MRKLFNLAAAFAVVAAMFSCSKNNDVIIEQEEYVNATFSVEIPQEILTRSIGDGKTAKILDFAVYRSEAYTAPDGTVYPAGEYLAGFSNSANSTVTKTADGEWKVDLVLVKNMKYDIVFWAHAENAPYTFNKAEAKIVVDNYTTSANAEVRDAFYKCCEDYVAINTPIDVDLTRPFAQINFGADDYDPYVIELGLNVISKIDTKEHAAEGIVSATVPNTLNVLDGSVSGAEVVDFALAAIPYDAGEKVLIKYNGKDYSWVAMNYILAGEENTLGNLRVTFNYNSLDLPLDVTNVPYKRNCKTNILGSLFTINSEFKVVIIPGFDSTLPPIEIN